MGESPPPPHAPTCPPQMLMHTHSQRVSPCCVTCQGHLHAVSRYPLPYNIHQSENGFHNVLRTGPHNLIQWFGKFITFKRFKCIAIYPIVWERMPEHWRQTSFGQILVICLIFSTTRVLKEGSKFELNDNKNKRGVGRKTFFIAVDKGGDCTWLVSRIHTVPWCSPLYWPNFCETVCYECSSVYGPKGNQRPVM